MELAEVACLRAESTHLEVVRQWGNGEGGPPLVSLAPLSVLGRLLQGEAGPLCPLVTCRVHVVWRKFAKCEQVHRKVQVVHEVHGSRKWPGVPGRPVVRVPVPPLAPEEPW